MAYQSRELRLLAKKANQRMRELEKRAINAPAYRSAQGRLEMLGVRAGSAAGRRFSETGKYANKNEAKQMEKVLREFLGQRTSTVKGYKSYQRQVLRSAEERFGLSELGISPDEYLQIWENLPDDEQDRVYGSDETVQIVSSVLKTQRGMKDEQAFTVSDIVNKLQESSSLKSALRGLGLEPSATLKNLGAL